MLRVCLLLFVAFMLIIYGKKTLSTKSILFIIHPLHEFYLFFCFCFCCSCCVYFVVVPVACITRSSKRIYFGASEMTDYTITRKFGEMRSKILQQHTKREDGGNSCIDTAGWWNFHSLELSNKRKCKQN